jgi:DNA-binding transcriptional ArsR family regulator
LGHCNIPKRTAALPQEEDVAGTRRFTRIPKTTQLIASGVPTEVVPTYCCLADYANNKTGLCWPKMESLARTLNRSIRTVQRHLHLLRELGLIEFVQRRRYKGRFSSYMYKICFLATTGHGGRMEGNRSNKRRTKQLRTPPISPSRNVKDGYSWLFGDSAPREMQDTERKQAKDEEAKRRTQGYEWLFDR